MNEQPYEVILHAAEGRGFWTEVPSLPGCGSQGETIDEAIEMTKDAIEAFIESMRKHGEISPGEVSPKEHPIAVTVTVLEPLFIETQRPEGLR